MVYRGSKRFSEMLCVCNTHLALLGIGGGTLFPFTSDLNECASFYTVVIDRFKANKQDGVRDIALFFMP